MIWCDTFLNIPFCMGVENKHMDTSWGVGVWDELRD